MRVKVLIAHCGWAPERKPSLDRLLAQVTRRAPNGEIVETADVLTSPRREHASVWARRAWEWIEAQSKGTPVALLNDDVTVCPQFQRVLGAMVEAAPFGRAFSLHTTVPGAAELSAAGHRWVRTYWYTGPGVMLTPELARELLDWVGQQPPSFFTSMNEDNVAIHWAWSRQEPFWCPIPAVVRHDVAIPSTLGYDHHAFREPVVTWDGFEAQMVDPRFWDGGRDAPPFVPNPWMGEVQLQAMRAQLSRKQPPAAPAAGIAPVCSFCLRRPALRGSAHNGAAMCAECLRALAPAVGARFTRPEAPRVVIATPTRGGVHPAHAAAVWALRSDDGLNVESAYEPAAWWMPSDDLVRVRSRLARDVVNRKEAGAALTHLLLVDADVAPTPATVRGMLAANRPMVAAPYPLRAFDFARAAEGGGGAANLEARALTYVIEALPGEQQPIDEHGCVEVAGMPLGCALIQIELLERMIERYGREAPEPDFAEIARALVDEEERGHLGLMFKAHVARVLRDLYRAGAESYSLVFDDRPHPGALPQETVALFQLELWDRALYSEDKSFCHRVRAMGEKVFMYLGPGSPVDHYGDMRFRGMKESLDIRPVAAVEGVEE